MNSINELAANYNYFECKICKLDKVRIRSGNFPNGKDPKYVDHSNRQWNGKMCPQCHTNMINDKKKDRRRKKRLYGF